MATLAIETIPNNCKDILLSSSMKPVFTKNTSMPDQDSINKSPVSDSCCAPSKPLKLNILKSQARFGCHVPLQNSLYETISWLPDLKCVQTFLGNPITYDCRMILKSDKEKTAEYCEKNDMSFYIHCPYIANLAKPKNSSSIRVVSKELNVVTGLPAACVLHIGKVGTAQNVGESINQIMSSGYLPVSHSTKVPFHLLLEVAAGQGTEIGKNWHEIRHLYEALDKTRVGLCLDTQHAFASGMCNFQSHEEVIKLFDMANSIVNKGISLIHINDSAKGFNCHVDRHAALQRGHIWSKTEHLQGLGSLLRLSKEYGYDLISETDDPFGDNALIKAYMNSFN